MQTAGAEVHRFDIYCVTAAPGDTRPYLVVSSDAANQKKHILSVAPITSNTARIGASSVLFHIDGRDSVVLLDRVTTIDKARLGKFLGKLAAEKALTVATVLNQQFIPENFTPEPLKHTFVLNTVVTFEEDRRYEFKGITSARPASVIKNVADEYAVAFLNSEGGRILWVFVTRGQSGRGRQVDVGGARRRAKRGYQQTRGNSASDRHRRSPTLIPLGLR